MGSLLLSSSAALICGMAFMTACGDDDGGNIPGAGAGGGSGSGGGGGDAGSAGSAGDGGSAGSAGGQNAGGTTGTVEVLSTAEGLRAPTTAAVRGNNLWVVNGQLAGLFGGPAPVLPFNVVSIPLTGGAIGTDVIALQGDTFYPEGIAAAADGTLYVGSVSLGTVVRIPANSTTPEAFVADSVSAGGVIGLTVDAERDLLWFCDSTFNVGASLVGVALDDGTETVRHNMPNPGTSATPDAGPDGGEDAGTADAGDAEAPPAAGPFTFCNDVIVDANDNVLATDSSGRIFRVPAANALQANSAEVWLEAPAIAPPMPGGFGVNGLDLVGGQLIVANGGLFAIDPNSANPASTIRPITLTLDGAPATLCGPDGLQSVPGSTTDIVVVENGGCMPSVDRVVRVTLDLAQ
jgi:hypothetical protein